MRIAARVVDEDVDVFVYTVELFIERVVGEIADGVPMLRSEAREYLGEPVRAAGHAEHGGAVAG